MKKFYDFHSLREEYLTEGRECLMVVRIRNGAPVPTALFEFLGLALFVFQFSPAARSREDAFLSGVSRQDNVKSIRQMALAVSGAKLWLTMESMDSPRLSNSLSEKFFIRESFYFIIEHSR